MPSLARLPLPLLARARGSVAAPLACRRFASATTTPPPGSPPPNNDTNSNVPHTPPTPGAGGHKVLEPTTFDGKAAPRDVHNRPGLLRRGLPPASTNKLKPWEEEQRKRVDAQRRAMAVSGDVPRTAFHRSTDEPQNFDGPSRPRLVYTRPAGRALPRLKNRLPLYIGMAALGLGSWGLFILYATNNERLSSSVVRQVTFQLRNSADVAAVLGDGVRLERNWWGGDPWIHGNINLMQGRIDLKFRVQGSKQFGTVMFTAIRPEQSSPWRIVRYKLTSDSGDVVRLEETAIRNVD